MVEITEDTKKRISAPRHHIDAGFINRKKCLSVFGRRYAELYEQYKHQGDDHMSVLTNDHLLIQLALDWCSVNNIPSLGEVLSNPKENQLFCSTENIIGCGNVVYDAKEKNFN